MNVIVSYLTLFGPTIPPYILELKQEAQNYLNKVKEKIENSMDSKHDEHKVLLRTELIGSLSAVDGIVAFAEKDNVDLIIVGTRGRSGFKRFLLGSVALGVITYAHCPVMVVK